MPYNEASFLKHAPTVAQLTSLISLTFSGYQGVIDANEDFVRWYTDRPGLDTTLSRAYWFGNEPVASIFVTRAVLSVAGKPHTIGLVDTVMTHPAHRRKSLARQLLQQALAAAEEQELDGLQLYTAPGSAGYHLYQSLGFCSIATLRYWRRLPGVEIKKDYVPSWAWKPAGNSDRETVLALIHSLSRTHDGVPLIDLDLWTWRRIERPTCIHSTTWLHRGTETASQTISTSAVTLTDGTTPLVLSDLIIENSREFSELAAYLGQQQALVALSDVRDVALQETLSAAGFFPEQEEAVMIYPMSERIVPSALAHSSRPWFPLMESIVGV